MSIYEPEATPSLGATKVAVCTAIADPAAPKLATEINAASSVEGTLVFREGTLRARLPGALVILSGVAIIALAG